MLSWLGNAWRVPELRKRVLFTAFALAVYRLGSWMPAPGVDSAAIESYFNGSGGSILGLLSLFSGGALSRFSLFALGIMPYVTASIIVELLTVVIPRLAELQKEGEAGYAKINQYTRYLTVVLAALQAFGYAILFERSSTAGAPVLDANAGCITLIVVTLTTGTVLLMWIGEQITKRGIGNGISILIFASILTSLPLGLSAWWNGGPMERIFFPLIAIAIVASVVYVQEGQRRIPIQYAKRMVGRRMTTGGADVPAVARQHGRRHPGYLRGRAARIPRHLSPSTSRARSSSWNDHFQPGNLSYLLTEAALIILFTYFYTAVQFNPVEQADNQRKYGGYIPGIRPGPPTAQLPRSRRQPRGRRCRAHSSSVCGRDRAEHLHQVRRLLRVNSRALGGTSVLIAVGVALDTMRQMESQMMMRNYSRLPQNNHGQRPRSRATGVREGHAGGSGSPRPTASPMRRRATSFEPPLRRGTELGRQVEPMLASGELVPDELTIALIRARLLAGRCDPGLCARRLPAQQRPGRGAATRCSTRSDGRSTSVLFFDLDGRGRRRSAWIGRAADEGTGR